MNKTLWKNAKYVNRARYFDYETKMFQRDDVWYYKYGKNKKRAMLSVSTWLKAYNKIKLADIPFQTLEQARIEGQALMFWIEYIFKNKIKNIGDLNYESQKIQEMVFSVVQCLIDNNMKIVAVEKHITNGYWHGYIDLLVKEREEQLFNIIEIKTRTGFEIRETDILQLIAYKKIMNFAGTCWIMVVDKTTRTAQLNRIDTNRKYYLVDEIINTPLKALNMKDYCLPYKTKTGDLELYEEVKNSSLEHLRQCFFGIKKEIS